VIGRNSLSSQIKAKQCNLSIVSPFNGLTAEAAERKKEGLFALVPSDASYLLSPQEYLPFVFLMEQAYIILRLVNLTKPIVFISSAYYNISCNTNN